MAPAECCERPKSRRSGCCEVLFEEGLNPIEGDDVHLIVKVDMIGPFDDHQFLRLCRSRISILTAHRGA